MSIKIISDGTPYGTHIFNEDGTEIKGVTEITWHIDASDDTAIATLKFAFVQVEVTAEHTAEYAFK